MLGGGGEALPCAQLTLSELLSELQGETNDTRNTATPLLSIEIHRARGVGEGGVCVWGGGGTLWNGGQAWGKEGEGGVRGVGEGVWRKGGCREHNSLGVQDTEAEVRSCVKVEVAVLGLPVPNSPCGLSVST